MKLSTQVWGLLTVVVCGAVLAAGWFLGVSPFLAAQATAEQQRQDSISQNNTILAKIQTLKDQKTKLADYEKRNAELEETIPSDIEAADFIRSLNDLADNSGVELRALTFGDALPYVPPAGDPADPERAPNPVTDGRITGENFLLVPITLQVSGGWNEVLAFTHGVQTGSRLVLVTTVNTTEDNGTFTTSLSGAMYVLVRPAAPAAGSNDGASDTDAPAAG